MLSTSTLESENVTYAGTGGVSHSHNNRTAGFRPAFLDVHTGRVERARFANGQPAPMHVIEGVPREWAARFDAAGRITALRASIVSGFIRDGRFFTREQAAALAAPACEDGG